MDRNRQVVLAARPDGIPEARHFSFRDAPMPTPGEGEILVRNRFLSIDPAMRGWVSAVANYSDPVDLGEVMRSITLAEVVRSSHPAHRPGDLVCGMFGWQEYAARSGDSVWFTHDPNLAPPSTALGVLGVNGMTAYLGLLECGRPRAGETVVVSTAAGAVGSAVGQIAKIMGCRTVGITSSETKMSLCRDVYSYDAVLPYHSGDLDAALADACPDGIDVYFDNTAGHVSDAVHRHLAAGARIVICGTAAISSWDPWPHGPRAERHILVKRATMQGFLIFDHMARFAEARTRLAEWLADGRLDYREEILDGLDQAPGAIARLYAGENLGKLLIRI